MAALARTPVFTPAPVQARAASAAPAKATPLNAFAKPFIGFRAPLAMGSSRTLRAERASFAVKAEYDEDGPQYEARYPDPEFIQATIAAFPEAAIANADQARALFSHDNYVWLDVRPLLQYDSVGHVLNRPNEGHRSVHVPATIEKKKFEDGGVQITSTDRPMADFIADLEKAIPDKNTKIIVGDRDGKTKAIDCLQAMDEAGYFNIVGMKGGFRSWYMTWDNKLARRNFGEYQERMYGDDALASGDSCGIHSSGAGFENQDRASGDFWDNM